MKFVLALLFGLCLTATALAVDWSAPDYAYRGTYPPSATRDWSGAYLGGHMGYGWGGASNDWYDTNVPAWVPDGNIDYRSPTGGAFFGYQQQSGSIVAGVEADISLARYLGDDSQVAGRINEIEMNALGSLRGRLGFASENVLIYGTAGLAVAHFDKRDRFGFPNAPQWAGGWTAGGGVELAIDSNWSLRAEYLHTRLGDVETGIIVDDGWVGTYVHRANAPTINVLRVGASYRF